MAQVTKNGKSSSGLNCNWVYKLKPTFAFLFASFSSGFANILALFSPTAGRLSPPAGCGRHRDAPATSPFQTGLAASCRECNKPTASSCQMPHLQKATSLEVTPFLWWHASSDLLRLASHLGPVQDLSGLYSLQRALPGWLRLCQTCTAIHYVSFPFLLQGLNPNKHLHPKLHCCLPPENQPEIVGDLV